MGDLLNGPRIIDFPGGIPGEVAKTQRIGTNHIAALAVDGPEDRLPQLSLAPFDVDGLAAPAGAG